MATIYFQLERSKTLKDKTHPIYLVLKIKEGIREKRYRHYTGRSALEKHWIGKGNKKRVSSTAPGATTTNERLQSLLLGADSIISNAQNLKVELTLDYFKARFETEVLRRPKNSEIKEEQISFFEHLQTFISARINRFQPATIKTYLTLKKSLENFQKSTGYKVEFETINQLFITLYIKYLIEETKVINNTVAKRIATLKAFLAEMKRLKVNSNSDFESFEASRNYETTIMYLTESELLSLQNIDIVPNSSADHIRDSFCFACHTGLRFSDWGRLGPENLASVNLNGKIIKALRLTMFKVHKEITVPLDDYALGIIEKYSEYSGIHYKLFPVYSNQETNRTLKTIAQQANISEVITEIKKSGAKRINYTFPKFQILTCHDARNTFATLYLERGGRPEILKKILGHTDIKQTMRYVKITEKAVLEDHLKIIGLPKTKVLTLKKPA